MKRIPRSIFALVAILVLAIVASAQSAPPAIFFTDLDSGAATGGENVNGYAGAYVTLYGNNFGASQGSSTVTLNGANCGRIVSWGTPYLWYQKIVVQLGATCSTGNFQVTVGGQSSNTVPFTVRSGRIFFVATTGNDSNAGSFASPWRTIQHGLDSLSAGDIVYVMNGVSESTARAYQATVLWSAQGTAGNPVALVAYPGATVTISNTSQQYAIRCNAGYSTSTCQYSTIAGIKMVSNATFALGIMYSSNNWRIIANDLSCPTGDGQDGCFHASQGGPWYFYGNYIHDNATGAGNSSKQYHSVYFTTDANHVWVGWNKWYNNKTCRALQFHSSPTGGGDGLNQYDLHVHDNFFDGDRCNGINFATIDPSKGKVEAYNNLIINVGLGPASTDGDSEAYAAIYSPNTTNTGSQGTGTFYVYNNTIWHTSTQNPFGSTAAIETVGSNMTMDLKNNLVYEQSGTAYVSKLSGGIMTGSNNLWFGNGASPSGFSNSINSDPLFVSTAAKDFRLSSGSSPANGAGIAIPGLLYDLGGLIRPSTPAIGAYEYASGTATATPTRPNPPTNLSVTVN